MADYEPTDEEEPVKVPTEQAQSFERTLMRKANVDELPVACEQLASAVGGNPGDLLTFAEWTVQDAQIYSLAERQNRKN